MLSDRAALRAAGIAFGFLLVLTARAHAGPARATAAEIDLGTRTLGHRELALGPLQGSFGLWDRAMVGTYVAPWSIALVDDYSVIPNAFVKVEVAARGRFSAGVRSALFYAKLEDLDEDGLNARAIVWPTQLLLGARWSRRWATTVEATGVLVQATADKLDDQDTEVYGVALANTFHVGVVQRFQWRRGFALWARVRAVLGHAPVRVQARATLSDAARLRIDARANSAELSSAGSAMLGFVWTWRRTNVRLGAGYGHWILPWVLLPVGKRMPTGDVSLYWRF